MEKTRDLFKKIGDTKGTFHSKMGTLESRNARTLQKQKRWQEYTEKVLMTRITMMVCSTHLESNILECEVKWTLENNFNSCFNRGKFEIAYLKIKPLYFHLFWYHSGFKVLRFHIFYILFMF